MLQFLTKFLYITKGKHKKLIVMLLLFILISFLEMLGISIIGPFISLATNPDSLDRFSELNSVYERLNLTNKNQFLLLLGVIAVVIFYIKSFLSFISQKIIFEFGFSQQGELSSRLMEAYLKAPYTFHLEKNSAVIIQNIINETHKFSNGVMMPLLTSISNTIIIVALIFLLIKTNAMAMVVIGGLLIVSLFLYNHFKNRLLRWGRESSESLTEMIRSINHGLGSLKETKVIGCEAYFNNQLKEQALKYGTSMSAAVSFSNLPRYAIEAFLITFLVGFTILFVTFKQESSQSLNSILGIFALASIRLLPAAGNLASAINGIKYSSYSLDQIYSDLKELEKVKVFSDFQQNGILENSSSQNLSKAVNFENQIVLDKVVYCYPNTTKKSLDQISLTIKKGESIGLMGKSGAGKTTLVDVLLGLLIPQNGDIKVDSKSIYTNLRLWQNAIGYVPQSIFLIDNTLEKNIAFGVPDNLIDQKRLNNAIAAAQLTELVEQLTDGIKTMVGERGVLLSGGQRQRVGIARALYHEREILVFDEATAALDNDTEGLVTESIKALSGIKTMIIIAHRLSTIEHCNRIYMLDKGQIVTSGNYREVVLKE